VKAGVAGRGGVPGRKSAEHKALIRTRPAHTTLRPRSLGAGDERHPTQPAARSLGGGDEVDEFLDATKEFRL
jgi:hypothetical protein